MKKLLAIIVTVLCMAMLFTGCAGAAKNAQPNNAASNETEAADKQLIFVNPKSIGYAYWDNAKRGAENAGKDVGTEIVAWLRIRYGFKPCCREYNYNEYILSKTCRT